MRKQKPCDCTCFKFLVQFTSSVRKGHDEIVNNFSSEIAKMKAKNTMWINTCCVHIYMGKTIV